MQQHVPSSNIYEHIFEEDRAHTISVMGQNGDSVHIWDPEKPVEVEIAQSVYDKFLEKGYRPFQMDLTGEQGTQLDAFNPQAKAIIFVPPMRGG
jgi:hypothetical protein